MADGFVVEDFLAAKGLAALGAIRDVKPLAGGYWNQVFRVRGERPEGAFDWVVKRYDDSPEAELFANLPDHEARALEILDGFEVAPAPIGFFAEEPDGRPVLVYAFYAGRPWQEGVEAVAAVMRRQHAPEPAARAAELRRLTLDPALLLDQGDALLAKCAGDRFAEALAAVRPSVDEIAPPRRLALVHGDLGPGNIIVGEAGPRIIDWQCPGLGDACEDLYCFQSPAFQILYDCPPLSAAQRQAFLAAYDPSGAAGRRLAALTPAWSYRMLAYCCRRRQMLADRDPAASARYARALAAELAEVFGRALETGG
jgi:aminoglycoside phosphotransferase (APT) family kinase protein